MNPSTIPSWLRGTYLISFVLNGVFGLSGLFAARMVGNLAGHPVKEGDLNVLLGSVAFAFAIGSWFARRATRWEQISLATLVIALFTLVAGVAGVLIFLVPTL